jgi:ABC-type amino acid transport substrate-binding protein
MKVCYTAGPVKKLENCFSVSTNAVEIRIWFLTDDILRIRAGFDGDWDEASYSLTMTAWDSRTDELMKDCRKRVQTAAAELKTVESGKLIMSTNAAFPPYEMVADDGSFEGIDVEVAGAIAEKLGLELVVDDMDFDAALLAVQQNKSDIVMAGVTVTEDRQLVMNFSDSYATGVQVVIVKEGSDVTLDNLGEKMIGTQRGTTGYIYTSDDYGDDHVTAYDNGASAVQALINGQVDCVVIDSAPAEAFVAANAGLTILDTEYVTESYAIGVNKDNTALLDAINQALAELTADGTVQSIVDKYISAE